MVVFAPPVQFIEELFGSFFHPFGDLRLSAADDFGAPLAFLPPSRAFLSSVRLPPPPVPVPPSVNDIIWRRQCNRDHRRPRSFCVRAPARTELASLPRPSALVPPATTSGKSARLAELWQTCASSHRRSRSHNCHDNRTCSSSSVATCEEEGGRHAPSERQTDTSYLFLQIWSLASKN